jgi:hypothetical protein
VSGAGPPEVPKYFVVSLRIWLPCQVVLADLRFACASEYRS